MEVSIKIEPEDDYEPPSKRPALDEFPLPMIKQEIKQEIDTFRVKVEPKEEANEEADVKPSTEKLPVPSSSSVSEVIQFDFEKNQHKCAICLKTDRNYVNIETHLGVQHKIFFCPACPFTSLEDEKAREAHVAKWHMNSNGSYQCSICRWFTFHRLNWRKHIRTHTAESETPLVCSLCGSSVGGVKALNEHYEARHKREGVFVCPRCKRTASSANDLRLHVESSECQAPGVVERVASSSEKCPLCPFRDTKESLQRHLLETHKLRTASVAVQPSSEKLKMFKITEIHTLKQDMEEEEARKHPINLLDDRFRCMACAVGFQSASDRIIHIEITHKSRGGYTCPWCNAFHTKLNKWTSHMSCCKQTGRFDTTQDVDVE